MRGDVTETRGLAKARSPVVSAVVSRIGPQGLVQRHRCGGERSPKQLPRRFALGEASTHVLSFREDLKRLVASVLVGPSGSVGSGRPRAASRVEVVCPAGREPMASVRVACDPIRLVVKATFNGVKAPAEVAGIPRGSRAVGAVSERLIGRRSPGGNIWIAPTLAPFRCSP